MAAWWSLHSRAMSHRAFLGVAFLGAALSVYLVACFAKTTSLGSEPDTGDRTDAAVGSDGGVFETDASLPAKGLRDASCAINPATAQPFVPCSSGELGVGREYCKSDDRTCGGAGHCTLITRSTKCLNVECGCDKKIYCTDGAAFLGHVNLAPSGFCSFPCGTKTCDGLKEHCWHGSGGPMLPDGGASTIYECKPVPTECATDHTCTCLLAHSGSAGPCTDTDGYLDLEVFLP